MYKAFKVYGNDIETDLPNDLNEECYSSGMELYNDFKNEIYQPLGSYAQHSRRKYQRAQP